MGENYIYSTHATDVRYVKYGVAPKGNVPPELFSVTIKGGAGVATKHLITPRGAATRVSEEQLAFLMGNEQFLAHITAGFVTVGADRHGADAAAANLNEKDKSRPLTAADYVKGGRAFVEGRDKLSAPTYAAGNA